MRIQKLVASLWLFLLFTPLTVRAGALKIKAKAGGIAIESAIREFNILRNSRDLSEAHSRNGDDWTKLHCGAPSQGKAEVDAEVRTFGDPSLRNALDARAHAIYESANERDARHVFLLTRDNPLSLAGATGTEAVGVFVGGIVARIVASVWTKRGKYSAEYYAGKEGLFFVYESFVFFEGMAPRGAWRNFMGLPAWERRTYFKNDHSVAFAEVRGAGAPPPGSDVARLNDQSLRITALIQLLDRHK